MDNLIDITNVDVQRLFICNMRNAEDVSKDFETERNSTDSIIKRKYEPGSLIFQLGTLCDRYDRINRRSSQGSSAVPSTSSKFLFKPRSTP